MWIFRPIFKPTIWGGNRIAEIKKMSQSSEPIGESWEVSAVPGSESIVAEGSEAGITISGLCERYREKLLGKTNYERFGNEFPLLVKFIDAAEDLSVQVHPDDMLAHQLNFPRGKSEMWYVVDSDPETRICLSFTSGVNQRDIDSLHHDDSIVDKLRFESIAPGDAFYIPAGTVHALGKGALIVEIQQTSDVTFRIFDYFRRDRNGNLRELHTDLAARALKLDNPMAGRIHYNTTIDRIERILPTPNFTVNRLKLTRPYHRNYDPYIDSFKIVVAVRGDVEVSEGNEKSLLKSGSTALLPASSKDVIFAPCDMTAEILEAYIE